MSGMTTFQNLEVRKFGEAIYDVVENELSTAIVDHLGCGRFFEEPDANGEKVPYTFSDLFQKLRESGFTIDHDVLERGGVAILEIRIYEEISKKSRKIVTKFDIRSETLDVPQESETDEESAQ